MVLSANESPLTTGRDTLFIIVLIENSASFSGPQKPQSLFRVPNG